MYSLVCVLYHTGYPSHIDSRPSHPWARTYGSHFIGSFHRYGSEEMDLISLGPFIDMGQKRWTSFHWVLTSKLWSKYFAVWTLQLVDKSKVKCLWKQPVHLYDNEYVTRTQNIPVCYNQAGNLNLLSFMKFMVKHTIFKADIGS